MLILQTKKATTVLLLWWLLILHFTILHLLVPSLRDFDPVVGGGV